MHFRSLNCFRSPPFRAGVRQPSEITRFALTVCRSKMNSNSRYRFWNFQTTALGEDFRTARRGGALFPQACPTGARLARVARISEKNVDRGRWCSRRRCGGFSCGAVGRPTRQRW